MEPPSISFGQDMTRLSRTSLILKPWLDLVLFLFFWVGNPSVCGVTLSHLTNFYGIEHQFSQF